MGDGEAQKSVQIGSIRFNVLLGGPQHGRLIVLSHALMANLHMWDALIPHLHGLGYRTLRYDHIGHGGTSQPAETERFHFDDFTRHIHDLVGSAFATGEASGEQKVRPRIYAIIGCSMGGVLALRYGMLRPDFVLNIIACDAPGLDSLDMAKPKWQARVAEFEEYGSDELCRKTVDRWFPPPFEEETKASALKMVRTCSFRGYSACADAIQNYGYLSELSKVSARTMVLVGENDEAVGPPEVLLDVARRIKGSEYISMRDAGHLPPMHRPDEFARVVLGFLDSSS